MPNRHFLSKAFEKIGKVDKRDLEQLVAGLRSEERFLREILDHAREGVLVISSKLEVWFLNNRAELLTGCDGLLRRNEPLDNVIEDDGLRDLIKRAIESNREIYDQPAEIFIPRHLHLNVTVQKLRAEPAQAYGAAQAGYVVSLATLPASYERGSELARRDKMNTVISLADGIAHEIGNPLNSINIHLQLLAEDVKRLNEKEREPIEKTVQIVADETRRLDQIIRHFLKASRRKPVQFHDADIHDVLQNVLHLLQPEIDAHRIEVKTSFDPKIPKFLLDQDRLSQVYVNLIRNAIQAMEKGGTLGISTQMQKKLCVTSIADTGAGISRRNIPKIFDAYYTTKEEGSGLGLMIAYQIISEHGGKIDVKSKPGKGTVVNILLPIRTEKLQLPAPRKTAPARNRE